MYNNYPEASKNAVIQEIRRQIRFLILVISFVIVTLFSIFLIYFYKPISPIFDFLPDLSISVIMVLTIILALVILYLLIVSSRQTLRIVGDYSLRLDKLLNITKDLREEVYSDILLEKIMDYALLLTNSEAGSLLLMEDGNKLVFKIAKGEKIAPLIGTSVETEKGLIGWTAKKGLTARINDFSKNDGLNTDFDSLTDFEIRSVMSVPLKTKENVIGVLILLNKKDRHPYRLRDEEILMYLADQAAMSILKTKLAEDQKNYEIHLTEILLEAIDFQISDKKGHSNRVARYSNIIAKALNMQEEAMKKLHFASLLHDIGFLKMHSGDAFNKDELMQHPVIGYEMIKPITFYSHIAPAILHHHERYDGYGYPAKLKGEEIPLDARIIGIAEAFDAMTSETSYKIPISFEDALDELLRNAGTQFDPNLVQLFVANTLTKHTQ